MKKFNKKTETFESFDDNDNEKKNIISVIYEDKKRKIWLGTENGLSCIDKKNKKIITCSFIDRHGKQIKLKRVSAIWLDNSMILWVGTQNGLFKIDKKKGM